MDAGGWSDRMRATGHVEKMRAGFLTVALICQFTSITNTHIGR